MKVKKKILIAIAFVITAWLLYKVFPYVLAYVLVTIEERNDPNFYIGGDLPKVTQ